jgi:hypothetical protein
MTNPQPEKSGYLSAFRFSLETHLTWVALPAAAASVAFKFTGAHKLCHPAKYAFDTVEIP